MKKRIGKKRGWTELDDRSLVNFRLGGKTFRQIANVLGRTRNSCIGRYFRLKQKGLV